MGLTQKQGKEMFKKLWEKWKISISFIGGALVVASAYGTCTVEPDKEAIVKEVTKDDEKKEEDASKEVEKEEEKKEEVQEKEESEKKETEVQ